MRKTLRAAPARLALVGAGAIAQSYATALAASSVARLVAIADADRSRARRMAQPLGVAALGSLAEIIDTVPCDGVVVCTPPVYHTELAIDALRAGLHVLCEKPLAISAFAARRMFAAAEEAGRVLTVATKFRFVDDVRAAKELISRGAIGTVLHLENTFMSTVDMTRRWNSRVEVSGGGVLIDNGSHAVDIMRFLIGPIETAYAVDTSVDARYESCEDTASLFVRSADGVIGSILLSWTLPAGTPWFLRVHGMQGTIEVGWRSSLLARSGEAPVAFGTGYDKTAAFTAQVDDFAAAIAGVHPPAVERDDAIATVEVIDAAYDSLRQNAWSRVQRARLTPFERLVTREFAAS